MAIGRNVKWLAGFGALLVACSGGGSGGGDEGADAGLDAGGNVQHDGAVVGMDTGTAPDTGSPKPDGSMNGEPDGSMNGEPDGSMNGEPDGGSGGDAGADGGVMPMPETFDCSAAPTAVTTDALPSVLTSGPVKLTIGTLAVNASFTLCTVPAGSVPSAVASDAPIGDVYYVETDASSFGASVEADLTQGLLAALDLGAAGVAPVVTRFYAGLGAPAYAASAYMDLSAQTAGGTLSKGGFVYFRKLDAYAVDTTLPTASHSTGEVFDLPLKLAVQGAPAVVRTVSLLTRGCGIDVIGGPGLQLPRTTESCGKVDPVLREGASLDGTDGLLGANRVLDLTEDDAAYPPPRWFCPFAGADYVAAAELRFLESNTLALSVRMSQNIACALTGDRVAALDFMRAMRLQGGPILPTTWPYGTAIHIGDVRIPDAATRSAFTPLGDDGYYVSGAAAPVSVSAFDSATLAAPSNTLNVGFSAGVGAYGELGYQGSSYSFYPPTGGTLEANVPNKPKVSVDVAGFDDIGLQFGAAAGAATELSFVDGSIDALLVSGYDGSYALRFERWIRPSDLPLANGRRSAPLLETAQSQALSDAGISIALYTVVLATAAWDEARDLWTGGRVLPVLGGYQLNISPSRIAADGMLRCPADIIDGQNGCQLGPHEALLVATDSGVELFDPATGEHWSNGIDGGTTRTGFRHVIQGTDGCLYASQHDATPGVYRYRPTTVGITSIDADGDPYVGLADAQSAGATSLAPYGLGFVGTDLLIANGGGGVLAFGASASAYVNDPTLLARGLVVGGGDFAMVANQGPANGTQTLVGVPPLSSGDAPFTFVGNLSGPEQLVYDLADSPNVLLAQSGAKQVIAYGTNGQPLAHSGGGPTIQYTYAGNEQPRGIWPLLRDGHWLVAGTNGLGVDVVTPGQLQQSATSAGFDGDAYYIARACLPFDPR